MVIINYLVFKTQDNGPADLVAVHEKGACRKLDVKTESLVRPGRRKGDRIDGL